MTSKTIALSGAEIRVDYSGGTNAWLRNDGTDVIYASTMPGITAGADGVVSIPAGQAAAVYGAAGTVFLLGTGSVQLVGSDYTACPFKTSAQAGGSGADDVARAAISAHAGNAEVHVTTAEKAAWNGKAELSDIPDKLPADGGNADTAYAVDSANHKARLFEDAEGGNLRLESPDGSLSMEMDMYDNKALRMYFKRNGELVLPFLCNPIYNSIEIPKLNGARISSVGAKNGYVSSSIADVITYGERVVHKQSSDTSYIGWTATSDGWFAPIFVSKTVEGTRYAMNGNECMYSVDGEKCGSFTHNGETYYACWNNPGSLMNSAVSTSALYIALNDEDYVSACKTLIDTCEGVYANGGNADTLDGKHSDDFFNNISGVVSPESCGKNTLREYIASISSATSSFYAEHFADLPSADWGYNVTVNKTGGAFYAIAYKSLSDKEIYVRSCGIDGTWNGEWARTCDGGNAATLSGHIASDFELHHDYAPVFSGDILDINDMGTFSCTASGCTNLPKDIASWCYITVLRFRDLGYKRYICVPLNDVAVNPSIIFIASECYKDPSGNLIWSKACDGGNAASVGTYTEAKIAELEERIAALEVGR